MDAISPALCKRAFTNMQFRLDERVTEIDEIWTVLFLNHVLEMKSVCFSFKY